MIDGSLAFDIAASGMSAQRASMDLIAENLANADTTRGAGAAPYRARYAVFEAASPFSNALDSAFGDFSIDLGDESGAAPEGVRLASIEQAPVDDSFRFGRLGPFARSASLHDGSVERSGVDSISQMVKLIAAGRAYDADVAVLQGAKQMDLEATDIDR